MNYKVWKNWAPQVQVFRLVCHPKPSLDHRPAREAGVAKLQHLQVLQLVTKDDDPYTLPSIAASHPAMTHDLRLASPSPLA